MKESRLRRKVVGWFREAGMFVQSIESETTPGLPDTYILCNGVTWWLELKDIKEIPKRNTTSLFKSLNHPLLPEQSNWIEQCIDHGGNVAILVGHERRVFLVPGQQADTFNELTWEQIQPYEISRDKLIDTLRKPCAIISRSVLKVVASQ